MFAAAVQRKAQEDRLAKKGTKKPYSRPIQAVKLVFKPSPLKATIKSAAAFDAFRQTRDVKALFTHLYRVILAAHFVRQAALTQNSSVAKLSLSLWQKLSK